MDALMDASIIPPALVYQYKISTLGYADFLTSFFLLSMWIMKLGCHGLAWYHSSVHNSPHSVCSKFNIHTKEKGWMKKGEKAFLLEVSGRRDKTIQLQAGRGS